MVPRNTEEIKHPTLPRAGPRVSPAIETIGSLGALHAQGRPPDVPVFPTVPALPRGTTYGRTGVVVETWGEELHGREVSLAGTGGGHWEPSLMAVGDIFNFRGRDALSTGGRDASGIPSLVELESWHSSNPSLCPLGGSGSSGSGLTVLTSEKQFALLSLLLPSVVVSDGTGITVSSVYSASPSLSAFSVWSTSSSPDPNPMGP